MAGQVRIISGPRDTSFDHHIKDIIDRGAWTVEHHYFGITDQQRADQIRRKMKTAGGHMDPPVSVKAFWYPCAGCANGGPECRYHVSFTAYDKEVARAYKAAVADAAAKNIA